MNDQTWITVVFVVKEVLITDCVVLMIFQKIISNSKNSGVSDKVRACRQEDFSWELNKITENITNCWERGGIKYWWSHVMYAYDKVTFHSI